MRRRNSAFTLVEVLVVIAIIGILMSLTMSALGPAREMMRRSECANHQRQLALAATNFQLARGHLPGYCQSFGQFAGGLDPSDPGSYGGSVPPHVKIGGWQVALLAKLDNQPLYETWTDDRYPLISDGAGDRRATMNGYSAIAASNMSLMQCPSSSGQLAVHGKNNYVANVGMHADRFPFTYTRPGGPPQTVSFADSMDRSNGLFANHYPGIDPLAAPQRVPTLKGMKLEDITDGAANTLMFTENQQAQPWHLTRLSGDTLHLTTFTTVSGDYVAFYPSESRYLQGAAWHFEDPLGFAGAPIPETLHKINGGDVYNLQMTPLNMTDVSRPSSLHYDGVNVAFAGGSVRFVADTIDHRAYQALMTPSGRASDVPMAEYLLTDEF